MPYSVPDADEYVAPVTGLPVESVGISPVSVRVLKKLAVLLPLLVEDEDSPGEH